MKGGKSLAARGRYWAWYLTNQAPLDEVWVAVAVGLIVLLLLFRPRNRPARDATARGEGAADGQKGGGCVTSYAGWKVLVCLRAVQAKEGGDGFSLAEEELPVLRSLAQESELHVVAMVESDKEEDDIRAALERSGLFEQGLKRHRVLTCGTVKGKQAVARQLLPSIYVETHPEVVQYMAAHVPYLGVVADSLPAGPRRPNTILSPSLRAYVATITTPVAKAAALAS
eukprot:Rhum_TRINITY_DN14679_c38_g2::Rhum_TRINITY_DN14679_c38_g2_i1::g.110483::m.110483